MKFAFKKSTVIKIGIVLALLVAAPFLVPFTLDFIIMADLMGLEALIVFLFAYGKSLLGHIRARLDLVFDNMAQTALLVAQLYMFKPRVYLGHATVSSVVMVLACSTMLACAVWLPVMFVSAGYIT